MKFRFCGGRDCPDWLLAEISTLSRLTSIKAKLVCIKVCQSLVSDKKEDQVPDPVKLAALTADAKFSVADVQATVAALNFMLTSAAKYDCDVDPVISELQQLGLPKEHSLTIGKVFGDNKTALRTRLKEKSLKISGNTDVVDWSIQRVLASSSSSVSVPSSDNDNFVRLKIQSRYIHVFYRSDTTVAKFYFLCISHFLIFSNTISFFVEIHGIWIRK